MTTSNNEPITHGGEVFEMVDGLYYGYAKSQSFEKRQPLLHWQGAKIPWDRYCMWATFMRWAYATHKSEAQVTLVYHEEHKLWDQLVYPQEVSAYATEEIKTGDMTLYEGPLSRGFEVAGSSHSHAGMKAFQSGTDSHNELYRSGLHITLGSFDEGKLSFQARLTFRGYQYHTLDISQWIEFPAAIDELPEELRDTCREYYLVHPAEVEFPPEWKTRVKARTYGMTTFPNDQQVSRKNIPASVKGFTVIRPKDKTGKEREGFGAISNEVYSSLITSMDDIQQQVFRAMDGFGMNSGEVVSAARKAWGVNMQAEAQEELNEIGKEMFVDRLLTMEEKELLIIMEDFNCSAEEIGQDATMIEQQVVAMIVEAGGE